MAFFKALAAIGIGRTELADVSGESLIRIEKKLIAEQKLNNSISKNDVETVLRVFKDYPDVLKEISRYDCFYGILTGYDAESIDTLVRYPPEQASRIKLVVSTYFTDELTDYINVNLSQNNWNNIRVLLHYRIFFNTDILKTLTTRLEAKVEFGIATIETGRPTTELLKKLDYLRDKDFYFTLGEVDKRYFLKVLVKMIDLVKQNQGWAPKSRFFSEAKQAIRWYDIKNAALANKLGVQVRQQTTAPTYRRSVSPARAIYFVIIIVVMLYNFSHSCNNSSQASIPYITARNPWSGDQNAAPPGNLDSTRQLQRDKMARFVEARINPINYPVKNWEPDTSKTKKYADPFDLDIFSGSYHYVQNKVPRIAIANNTDKECVAIAYFRQRYDTQLKAYTGNDNINSIDIYAFYIPPHDSINVDMKMELLRFYMGKKLAVFDSYRGHNYPDSLDNKFSVVTRADSMLFSKAFVPLRKDGKVNKTNGWKKASLLTINQPTAESYLITWTGETPLCQFTNWVADVTDKHPDSLSLQKPLLLDLKNPPPANVDGQVNTFIYN